LAAARRPDRGRAIMARCVGKPVGKKVAVEDRSKEGDCKESHCKKGHGPESRYKKRLGEKKYH